MPSLPRNLLTAREAWRVASTDPFDAPGEVRWADGQLILSAGNPGTGLSYRGPAPRIDYRVAVEAQRTEGEDFFCGLTFPVLSQYATLIIGGWGGGVTGISNIDGMTAVENETTSYTPFENDRWYAIELRVTAAWITAAVDEKEILRVDVPDHEFNVWPEMEPTRPLGIATWKTSAAIRQFQLEKLAT